MTAQRGGRRRCGDAPLPGRGECGFTLLELALTLMIMGILLTLALPRLPRLDRTDLESSADRLASTMTYLADEASLRGRIYKLTLDLDSEQWKVSALAVFARKDEQATRPEFREDPDDPLSRSVVLPPGIVLDAFIDADGQTTSGQRAVFFLPEGLSENVDVRLADRDEETVLVKLSATRGQAQRDDLLEAPR